MIWVVGKNGMLGSQVCQTLTEKKIPFVATGHEVDICDYSAIENFILSYKTNNYLISHKSGKCNDGKITWIINCAGFTDVEKSESYEGFEEACKINEKGALNIARLSRSNNIKLIHISSDFVFDGKSLVAYTEKSEKNPQTKYGLSKSLGEDAVTFSCNQYYIIRTSWLYGYNKSNFVYKIFEGLKTQSKLFVVDDQIGCPTFAKDLSCVILEFIEKNENARELVGKHSAPSYGVYNFCNKGSTSRFDFACAIKKILLKTKKIDDNCELMSRKTSEDETKRPLNSVLDTRKIEMELGIKIPDWKKSLESFIKSKNF